MEPRTISSRENAGGNLRGSGGRAPGVAGDWKHKSAGGNCKGNEEERRGAASVREQPEYLGQQPRKRGAGWRRG